MSNDGSPMVAMVARMGRILPIPPPPDDFQGALNAVTGTTVDLRAAADPPGGFVSLGAPGKDHWWPFSAFGTELFTVDLNMPAFDAWADAIDTVENIDHEIFAGKYGLMNVQQLLDGEAMTQSLTMTLADAVGNLKLIVTPLENGASTISGTAVSVLLDQLHLVGDELYADMDEIEQPSPSVAQTLHDAATALKTFGEQMAYVYWESNHILLDAVRLGADAIFGNMRAYLRRVGLTPDSPQYQAALAADPEAAVIEARLAISRYSSSAVGDLPYNIAPISGDLSQPAVWAAANAAITRLITVELDKLDVVAAKVAADLKTAYDNASARLDAADIRPQQPAERRELAHGALIRPPPSA